MATRFTRRFLPRARPNWPGSCQKPSEPMRTKESVGALHQPAVPERGSVTRRTWGCSDALRLTEPRSHRVVRFRTDSSAARKFRVYSACFLGRALPAGLALPSAALAQGNPPHSSVEPQLTDLFWALFLLAASVVIGIIWVGL